MGQSALQKFQEELGQAIKDPYQVVMRQTKLPITLLKESAKYARVHLLETESFESTFGPKKQRKRPNLIAGGDLDSYLSTVEKSGEQYQAEKDGALVRDLPDSYEESREWIMKAGLSKRIWGELYKVIDCSDVVIQVFSLFFFSLWIIIPIADWCKGFGCERPNGNPLQTGGKLLTQRKESQAAHLHPQ